ncbi:MAG: helix-turn-helix transcriptional regulator [Bacillota bacterium]
MTILDTEKLKTLRIKKGYSQESLANKACLSTNFIGNIERGKDNIALDSLAQIAKALDVEPGTLLRSKIEVAANEFLWSETQEKERMYQQSIFMMETFDREEMTTIYLMIKLVFDSKTGTSKW